MRYKDDDRAMLNGIGINHFRDFGSSFKSTTADGFLRTGVHVDFSSKRNDIRPFSLNDNQRQTCSTEVADGSCALQQDISPAHDKGKEVVVQELSGEPRIQSKASEHIDDIPMEIIELMAKNQYERCLLDREEDKQPSQTTTSISKNALLIDLNETYDNSMDNTLWQPKPLGPNQQSSHNCQWLGSVPTTVASHPNPFPSSFRTSLAQYVSEVSGQVNKLDNPNTRNLNFDHGSKSSENYSNESSIPAMYLLSLMDPRLRSSIPIDQSRNTKFLKGPFSSVHHSKEFIGPQPRDCNKTAYSTKQWPFDFCSERVTPETSRENFPTIPPVGTFQSGKSSAENANSTFQASWNHHQEKKSKRKDSNSAPSYNNSHHQKPIFTNRSSDPGKFQLFGASDSMMLPLKFHMTDNAKKHKTKKA
ncbi:unnamed protein product [Arabis nemorensis]|uniref:Uncharacterized protein n=1 Tax=Arabis nemorensis TaxID=586526 RepID=A0A565CUA6_9BRAS|nr:unnamed protein product [Arabis nemorensis]